MARGESESVRCAWYLELVLRPPAIGINGKIIIMSTSVVTSCVVGSCIDVAGNTGASSAVVASDLWFHDASVAEAGVL